MARHPSEFLPPTPGQIRNRARWRHYGHVGSVKMMQSQLNGITTSPSTTEEAKNLARAMLIGCEKLLPALATMKEPT